MVELNCAGTVQMATHVLRQMTELDAGKILFTASITGEMVAPRAAVYAATKAFVLSLAHSLRYELKETGITVTDLQPGPTDTDVSIARAWMVQKLGRRGSRRAIDAWMSGKDHVYAASLKTKLEGVPANLTPGSVKGAMLEKMAKPASEK
jgi:short-subunit dehydrogenase